MKLLLNGLIKFVFGFLFCFLLLFLPAGTLRFVDAWVFLGLLFIPVFILGTFLFIREPKFLEKRLDAKEKESTQKGVLAFAALIFIAGFIFAGFDFRYSWSTVPTIVKVIASILFLFSYLLYAEVMHENSHLSRTIKVEENQKVIDTGLYGFVRHPMYLASILMFLMIPLILNSWISFICFAFYPVAIVVRICNEEKVLTEQLPGYVKYKQKVKYRILPFIW